jgi:uncharacterized membrane protein (DUF4010 family)
VAIAGAISATLVVHDTSANTVAMPCTAAVICTAAAAICHYIGMWFVVF